MRTKIILVLLAVLGGAVFGAAIAAWSFFRFSEQVSLERGIYARPVDTSESYPSVKVDETEYEFGAMDSEATGKHQFVFHNVGEAPLELKKGSTTCKCTLSDIGDSLIQPGQTGTVTLEWRGKTFVGPYTQTANILTNDPQNPRIELRIQGEITSKARVVPETVVFSAVSAGATAHASVRIFGYMETPLQITGYEIDDPANLDVAFSEISADEIKQEKYATSGQLVDVTLKPGLPPGPFHRRIRVKTSLKGVEELAIPVEGTITSEISIYGSGWSSSRGTLRLGTLAEGKALRQLLVKVSGLNPEEVKFEVGKVEPEFVKVRIGERTSLPGSQVAVTPIDIEIPEGSPPGNYLGPKKIGLIQLKTTHATVKELEIKLEFLIGG
ncbi:MAG: DUF1573 domain-containing protein [Thermoguttaceae bacterium]